ncbi:MAG: hypothetical protein MUO26_01050 [Methanotrichaceae archaeon]|nr:hypothetical protein [Methanotrichaceae archaeon]
MDTREKLDQLAEFQSQRDLIDIEKHALLDEVKIPAEVEMIVKAGMERLNKAGDDYLPDKIDFDRQCDAEYESIVIPEEIRTALSEIDKKRQSIMDKKRDYDMEVGRIIDNKRIAIQAEVEAQTKDIYEALAQRKAEIEVEFAGKSGAVDENIKKLTEEIKADVLTAGSSIKGKYYQGVYVKGRVTWDTSKMDGYAVGHPEVLFMRKEGEPSCTIRKI